MTWDANPDKDGNVWCPYFGTVNGVGRLNPETGELQEYLWESQSPRVGTRSVQMTHDGVSAWVVEEGGTLVKVDVKIRQANQVQRAGQNDEHGARRSQWNLVGFRQRHFPTASIPRLESTRK